MAISIILIVIFIIFSAFFSMSETAYTSLNKIQIQAQTEEGDKRAGLTLALANNYDKLLSTILIGNNIVNIASSSVATTVFTRLSPQYGAIISTIVMTIIILIFGEITPKTVANQRSSTIAKAVAPFLNLFTKIFSPLVWLLSLLTSKLASLFSQEDDSMITDEELLFIISEAEESGSISDYEHELISSAIKIDDVKVEEILTPRPDIFAIDINQDEEAIKDSFYSNQFSRALVYDGSIDNVLGVIHEKIFSRYLLGIGDMDRIEDCITEALIVYPWQRITLISNEMQESGNHFAVVKGEYGETLGIVTLEDILEELVGNIWDESDIQYETLRQDKDGSFLVRGTVFAEEVFDYFHIEIDRPHRSKTIGGFLVERLGTYANKGDFIVEDGHKLIAEEVIDARVTKVRIIVKEKV